MNLDDGTALTAFQIRRQGAAVDAPPMYAYASLRPRGGEVEVFAPSAVSFTTLANWTSPRTRATWPVARRVRIGERTFDTQPLMDNQELDSRATTGAVYWEGASRLLEGGRPVGRGYLEMTGYVAPMQL
jgi:predicted secreted hydrolase